MVYSPEKHHRHSIRLKWYDYSQPGAYFITICTQNHKRLFGNVVDSKVVLNRYGKIIEMAWHNLINHYTNIELDTFVVMPNHMHGIIILTDIVGAGLKPAPTNWIKCYPLSEIVRAFKTFSSRSINELRKIKGISVWQRNYYEHIIRNENKLNKIREYIINNPLQWQLDRENPERVLVGETCRLPYDNQWGHLEETIYGRKKTNHNHAW